MENKQNKTNNNGMEPEKTKESLRTVGCIRTEVKDTGWEGLRNAVGPAGGEVQSWSCSLVFPIVPRVVLPAASAFMLLNKCY